MKKKEILNNKEGFTLIELLAVIVILAIVTVIATRSILPYMSDSGKDSFAIEANTAKGAASDAMALMQLNQAGNNYSTKDGSDGEKLYCFTLANLKALGGWDKNDDSYDGKVVVTVPKNSNAYKYEVTLHSDSYYVNKATGTIKKGNVNSYSSSTTGVDFACTGFTQAS